MQAADREMAGNRPLFFSRNDHAWCVPSPLAADSLSDAHRNVHRCNWGVHETDVCHDFFNRGLCRLPFCYILYDEISPNAAIPLDVGIAPYAKPL